MRHPPVIDGFEFAESGRVLRGAWPVRDFPRLRDLLQTDAGEMQYVVSGACDAQRRPALRIELRGALGLSCQRCLQPLDYRVALDMLLTLARSQSEVDAEPVDSSSERVLGAKDMALRELLEDELVLAVPLAARHAVCAAQRVGAGEGSLPFAKLRGLLGPPGPGGRND